MKRFALLRHLRRHGCFLKREGANPVTGAVEAVPRHVEVKDGSARKICRRLNIADPN